MKLILFSSFLLLVSACATPYQPEGLTGGYKEMRVASDMFLVTFSANGYTSGDTTQKFFLRRCAEITHENGFTHFLILNSSRDDQQSIYHSPPTYSVTPNSYGGYNVNSYGGYSTLVNKPVQSGTIKLFSKDAPPTSLEANIILEHFRKPASKIEDVQNRQEEPVPLFSNKK